MDNQLPSFKTWIDDLMARGGPAASDDRLAIRYFREAAIVRDDESLLIVDAAHSPIGHPELRLKELFGDTGYVLPDHSLVNPLSRRSSTFLSRARRQGVLRIRKRRWQIDCPSPRATSIRTGRWTLDASRVVKDRILAFLLGDSLQPFARFLKEVSGDVQYEWTVDARHLRLRGQDALGGLQSAYWRVDPLRVFALVSDDCRSFTIGNAG